MAPLSQVAIALLAGCTDVVTSFQFQHTATEQTTGCATDSDCPLSSKNSKCCPADGTFSYGCTPGVEYKGVPTKTCSIPGSPSSRESQCACVVPESCSMEGGKPAPHWPYEAANSSLKQWLMVGDSISWGLLYDAQKAALAAGIQLTHTPGNAKNTWWGARCLNEWLGDDLKRWDLVSFNFGLHDLSTSTERIEPDLYGQTLASFVNQIHAKAPQAKLLWATSTPAPIGSERGCDPVAFHEALPTWGGCPPRAPSDVPIYNKAAATAFAATSLDIETVDLYSLVTAKCGEHFSACKGFQKPMEVHYEDEGNKLLGASYVAAASSLLK